MIIICGLGGAPAPIEARPDKLKGTHLGQVAAPVDGPIDGGEVLVVPRSLPEFSVADGGVRDQPAVEVVDPDRIRLRAESGGVVPGVRRRRADDRLPLQARTVVGDARQALRVHEGVVVTGGGADAGRSPGRHDDEAKCVTRVETPGQGVDGDPGLESAGEQQDEPGRDPGATRCEQRTRNHRHVVTPGCDVAQTPGTTATRPLCGNRQSCSQAGSGQPGVSNQPAKYGRTTSASARTGRWRPVTLPPRRTLVATGPDACHGCCEGVSTSTGVGC